MKKLRLLLSMVTATAVLFTACNPDNGGNTPPPAEPTVLEFYADTTMGVGELKQSTALPMVAMLPGHWLTLVGGNIEATLFMLDMTQDPMSYAYLSVGLYPVVAGSLDMGQYPETSCLMADPGYCNFFDYSTGKTYYPVVPETATDAEGNPYGITVEVNPASPNTFGQDLNYLVFNVPVVDDEGKAAVVVGSYTGALGFQVQAAKQTADFNFTQWGFKTFEATYNESYKVLTLACVGATNGDLTLRFNLTETEGKFVGQAFTCDMGGGSVTGAFWNSTDEVEYSLDSGRVLVEATGNANEYKLTVAERNPLVFWGQRLDYQSVGEFVVTINGLPEGL